MPSSHIRLHKIKWTPCTSGIRYLNALPRSNTLFVATGWVQVYRSCHIGMFALSFHKRLKNYTWLYRVQTLYDAAPPNTASDFQTVFPWSVSYLPHHTYSTPRQITYRNLATVRCVLQPSRIKQNWWICIFNGKFLFARDDGDRFNW
jgi:hypothetical protein